MKSPVIHQRENSKAGIIAVILSLLGSAFYFSLNLILSRHVSAAVYGDYYIVIQILTIAALLAVFGTNTAIIKFLPLYLAQNNQEKLRSFLAWDYKIVNRVTAALTIIGAILAGLCVLFDHLGIVSIDHYHPAVFSFWLIPLFAYSLITNSLLQGVSHVNISLFFSNVLLILFEILTIVCLSLFGYQLDIYNIFFVIGVAQMLIIILQKMVLNNKLKLNLAQRKEIVTDHSWLSYAKEMLFNNLILYAAIATVGILFETLGHDEAEVGVFAAINTVASIIFTVSSAISTLFSPKLSAETGNFAVLQKIVNKANSIRLYFTLSIAIVFVVFSHEILFMFNPKFTDYTTVFNIVIIVSTISVQASMASSLLLFSGAQKLEVYSNIGFLIIAIISSLLLIPRWGLTGAIYAQVISTVAAYSFDVVGVKKSSPIKTFFFI